MDVRTAAPAVVPGESATRARSRRWVWQRASSLRSESKVSKRGSRVGLAICLSFFTDLARSAQRQSTATSYRRGNITERSQESGPRLWDSKTGQLSQSASLLCYSPAATWLRHSHGSGAVRAQRREHDDDLHACPQQTRHRCEESAGLNGQSARP